MGMLLVAAAWLAQGVTLADVLELLTIPRGDDVEIREDVVVLIDPSKPRGPRVNRWKNQDLDSEGERVAATLESTSMSLSFDSTALYRDLLQFLSEYLGIPISVEGDIGKLSWSLRLRDVPADRILAWITLPHGLDARIEKGGIVVFKRAK